MYYQDMPLPKELWKICDEYNALIVLSELYSSEFSNLIHADRPDLQDVEKSIGVEVTRALAEGEDEIESLFVKLNYEDPNNIKHLDRLDQLGAKIDSRSGVLFHPKRKNNFISILKQFHRKLEKLNNGYQIFEHYHIFIISTILADDEMVNETVTIMNTIQKEYQKKYEIVYIYVPQQMIYIDLIDCSFRLSELPSAKQFEWSVKAREKVEENEQMANGEIGRGF